MLPWDLEDWITDEGIRVARLVADLGGEAALEPKDRLLHEVWLLDTEQRNGGISQYFFNWGLQQWQSLCELAGPSLPTFPAFAKKVDAVVRGSSDPYQAIRDCGIDLDEWYEAHHVRLVEELRAAVRPNG